MDFDDPTERGGALIHDEELVQEFGASVKDMERGGFGLKKTPQELWRMRSDPIGYALYQLEYELYTEPPFENMGINPDGVFGTLNRFPRLENLNTGVLVAAYLYRQKFPTGDVTAKHMKAFYGPFKGYFNKVDIYRYIVMYDRFREK